MKIILKSLSDWRITTPLLLLLIFGYTIAAIEGWQLTYDDSFISYRYAKNLAYGHGLVWNVGEPPTEGYSNLLLILVLAPFIKIGLDPLLVTRFISLASLFLAVYFLSNALRTEHKFSCSGGLFIAALLLVNNSSKSLWLIGLESVIYTFALLITFLRGVEFLRNGRELDAIAFSLMLFITQMLRPEAPLLLIAILPFLIYFVLKRQISLKSILFGSLVFIFLNIIYLSWKIYYFDSILPNPFYIKAQTGQVISKIGLASATNFLKENRLIILVATVPLLMLFFTKNPQFSFRRNIGYWFGILFIILNICFFARTDTLMDISGRFLYPLVPILIYTTGPGFVILKKITFENELINSNRILLCLVLLCFYSIRISDNSLNEFLKFSHSPSKFLPKNLASNSLMKTELKIGHRLAKFQGIENVKIAFGDAGVIPYFSGAKFLDTVGLNDSFIAKNRDTTELLDYFFNTAPDIFIAGMNKDRKWINFGHGPLGDFSKFSYDKRWDQYKYIGTSMTGSGQYDLYFFVNKKSQRATNLEYFLTTEILDGRYSQLPDQFGSNEPGSNTSWVDF